MRPYSTPSNAPLSIRKLNRWSNEKKPSIVCRPRFELSLCWVGEKATCETWNCESLRMFIARAVCEWECVLILVVWLRGCVTYHRWCAHMWVLLAVRCVLCAMYSRAAIRNFAAHLDGVTPVFHTRELSMYMWSFLPALASSPGAVCWCSSLTRAYLYYLEGTLHVSVFASWVGGLWFGMPLKFFKTFLALSCSRSIAKFLAAWMDSQFL